MHCYYCGKTVEENGVVREGHTYCNNLCRYSFEKFGNTSKSHSSVVEKGKIEGTNNPRHVDNKLNIRAAEAQKMAAFESFLNNNKYIKFLSTIFVLLIIFLIYRGILNHVENKQAFRILWICIGTVGFIAASAAKKKNKTQQPQTSADKQGVSQANFKSIFEFNYLKLVFAILTALLIYRAFTNYIEYKQTESFIKDLDKTMLQFNGNMNKFKMQKH